MSKRCAFCGMELEDDGVKRSIYPPGSNHKSPCPQYVELRDRLAMAALSSARGYASDAYTLADAALKVRGNPYERSGD